MDPDYGRILKAYHAGLGTRQHQASPNLALPMFYKYVRTYTYTTCMYVPILLVCSLSLQGPDKVGKKVSLLTSSQAMKTKLYVHQGKVLQLHNYCVVHSVQWDSV